MTRTQSDPTVSLARLGRIVKKLDLRSGTFVLLKSGTPLANFDNLNGLAQIIETKTDLQNVVFVVVDDFSDLSVLDEKQMNDLGWFHIEHLKKLAAQLERKNDEQN